MATRSFEAQYAFNCAACGHRHSEGVPAIYNDDNQLQAEHCEGDGMPPEPRVPMDHTTVMPRGKKASDRCSRCFQVPASNGECGCA